MLAWIFVFSTLSLLTLATPLAPSVKKYTGEVITDSYIVKLRDGASPTQVARLTLGTDKTIKTFSGGGGTSSSVFNGFTSKFLNYHCVTSHFS